MLFISSYLKLLDWHLLLDTSLPAPLDVLGAWLHHTEGALRRDGGAQQADQTVSKALQRHKVAPTMPNAAPKPHTDVSLVLIVGFSLDKDVLKSLEGHQQLFQRIHKDRSIEGVSVPPEQLLDMAERFGRHIQRPTKLQSPFTSSPFFFFFFAP